MLERIFKLQEHRTSVKREVIAGFTTFTAMAYILAVNPLILSAAGLEAAGLLTVTALAAALSTFLMAVLTNYPIALAPGMGLNAFFAYSVVLGMGVPWDAALGLVFWNGIFFLILSLTGVRQRIVEAIPHSLKLAITCGIGLFIAFIGLRNGGLIVANEATLVTLGDLASPPTLLVFAGILGTAILVKLKVRGAIVLSVLSLTVLGIWIPTAENGFITAVPERVIAMPPSIGQTFFALDLLYLFQNFSIAFPVVLALLFVDLFDTIGTLLGVTQRAGLLDENGRLPRIGSALTADACGTVLGACLGTSTTTSYIESAAGVEEGGRTGLTGVVVGILFLLSLFLNPIILSIPMIATAPALVIVGVFMMQSIKHLDLNDFAQAVPAVLTMLLMPLAFSISHGISIGIISYAVIMPLVGRAREVSLIAYILAALFLLHYLTI